MTRVRDVWECVHLIYLTVCSRSSGFGYFVQVDRINVKRGKLEEEIEEWDYERKILTNDIGENVDTFIHEKLISDVLLMQFCLNSTYSAYYSMQNVTFEVSTTTSSYYYILFKPSLLSKYLTNGY